MPREAQQTPAEGDGGPLRRNSSRKKVVHGTDCCWQQGLGPARARGHTLWAKILLLSRDQRAPQEACDAPLTGDGGPLWGGSRAKERMGKSLTASLFWSPRKHVLSHSGLRVPALRKRAPVKSV